MEILNYNEEITGNILGTFDIYIPALQLTLHKFRVIQNKKGGWFFTAPSFMKEISGEKKFFPYVTFSKERNEEFVKKVTDLLKPYVRVRQ